MSGPRLPITALLRMWPTAFSHEKVIWTSVLYAWIVTEEGCCTWWGWKPWPDLQSCVLLIELPGWLIFICSFILVISSQEQEKSLGYRRLLYIKRKEQIVRKIYTAKNILHGPAMGLCQINAIVKWQGMLKYLIKCIKKNVIIKIKHDNNRVFSASS